ncbi:MAG: hypothetical protein VKS61_03200 [Candidatus Sericytochromatia bacterium]|nr:hypothetical protein [Candidatus Sericytochromatia bacterium]
MAAFRFLAAAALLAVLLTPPPAGAAPARKPTPAPSASVAGALTELVEELEPGVRINWTTGRLTASGVGAPTDRGPAVYRRQLARRAALADAYRRLAAALELLRVDANLRVKDLAVTDDALRARLNDFVKAGRLLETNHWPDGSTELVLGVDLTGDRSLMGLVLPGASPAPEASPSPSAAPAASARPAKEVVTEPVSIRSQLTGVVLDARGLGAQPALLPKVRDKDGKAIELGLLPRYIRDGADLDDGAGLNPLSLKAQRVQGPLRADLVLGGEASDRLKVALRDGRMAPGARLVVVL